MARGQQQGGDTSGGGGETQQGAPPTETSTEEMQTSETQQAAETTTETTQENETQQESSAGETQREAPAAGETRDWRNDRIDRLTAIRRQLERDLAAARAKEPVGEPSRAAERPGLSETELEAEVERRATQRAAAQEYTRRCNEAAAVGQQKYGEAEFRGRIASLVSLVDGNDVGEMQAYHNLMLAALETGSAPDVLYELGSNLGEAQRILGLGPVAMGVALAKIVPQGAGEETQRPSGAPRPVRPVTPGAGGARVAINPDDPERADTLTTAEWMRRRNEQLSRRQGA